VISITLGVHLIGIVGFGAFKVVEAIVRDEAVFEAPPEALSPEPLAPPPAELLKRVRQSSPPRPQPIAVPAPSLDVPSLEVNLQMEQSRFGRGSGLGAVGAGDALHAMAMELGAIQFFGQEFAGSTNRMLFIIDMSASMIDPRIRGIDGYKLVVGEVVQTLESIPQGSFNLIAFAGAVEVYRGSFTTISPSKIKDAERWLLSMDPAPGRLQAEARGEKPNWAQWKGGRNTGTRTDLALAAAFSKRPESIILLSDGIPSKVGKAEIFTMLEEWQSTKPIPIHTVSYKSRSGGEFLRELAQRNEGTYKEVQ